MMSSVQCMTVQYVHLTPYVLYITKWKDSCSYSYIHITGLTACYRVNSPPLGQWERSPNSNPSASTFLAYF